MTSYLRYPVGAPDLDLDHGWSLQNGEREALESDFDFEGEGGLNFRVKVKSLEAEVQRLNAELRKAQEAVTDQEAARLAREYGFLSPVARTPHRLFASTPQAASRTPFAPSPTLLNASTILDDESEFRFDGFMSPAQDSPTSKLLRPPLRPKPHFITPSKQFRLPDPPPSTLLPVDESEEGDSSPGPDKTALRANAHHSPSKPTTPIKSPAKPSTDDSTLDPLSLSTPMKTPTRSFQLSTNNGPLSSDELPTPAVVTKLVYIQQSSHWGEQACLIVFIICVILLSFVFGMLYSMHGLPDFMTEVSLKPS